MSDENKIRDAADAIKGIVEAVPVYQDVVQPAAKEVGTALQTVAKTLHILLSPVSGLVWGYDKIKDFVSQSVAEKLRQIPVEQLRSPEPHIAGPALEALKYTGYQEELRQMYANLLATTIDTETAITAHPAFVEIIRQLSPDEALVMKYISTCHSIPKIDVRIKNKNSNIGNWKIRNFSFLPREAACANVDLGSNYLINLQRLGLVELRENYKLRPTNGEDIYQPLLDAPEIQVLKKKIESEPDKEMVTNYGSIILSDFGNQFCFACVYDGTHKTKSG